MERMLMGLIHNHRYNLVLSDDDPIWFEGERFIEFNSSKKSESPPFYPQRVSPETLTNQKSFGRLEVSPTPSLGSDHDNSAYSSSSKFEAEVKEKNKKVEFVSRQNCIQKQKQPVSVESSSLMMANFDNLPNGGKHSHPKDFVCPITSNVFDDSITLEIGQTYEENMEENKEQKGREKKKKKPLAVYKCGSNKIEDVESVETHLANNQVVIKGVIDPTKLVDYLYKSTKKQASIVKDEENIVECDIKKILFEEIFMEEDEKEKSCLNATYVDFSKYLSPEELHVIYVDFFKYLSPEEPRVTYRKENSRISFFSSGGV
jgi:hypothetical protein